MAGADRIPPASPDPDGTPVRRPAGTRRARGTRTPAAATPLVALLAALALGACQSGDDCDGGISGTGCGGGFGDLAGGGTDGPTDGALGSGDSAEPEVEARPFANSTPALSGINAGLRVVNLSSGAVDLVTRSLTGDLAVRGDAVPAGEVGALVTVDTSTPEFELVRDDSGATIARFGATLDPGTLTTLVAFDAADGTSAAEALVTRTGSGDPGVALVRVVYANADAEVAAARIAALSLEPAGDDPGGAAVAFEAGPDTGIASDYALVPDGGYALLGEGRSSLTSLGFEGGLAYTLFLGDSGGGGGVDLFITLVDGEVP